jgi:hypothetical protein
LYNNFISTSEIKDFEQRLVIIKKLTKLLPVPNYIILNNLCCFLNKTIQYKENKMNTNNLAMIFSISLLKKKHTKKLDNMQQLQEYVKEGPLANELMRVFIDEYEQIFFKNEEIEIIEKEYNSLSYKDKELIKKYISLLEKKVITIDEFEIKKDEIIKNSQNNKKVNSPTIQNNNNNNNNNNLKLKKEDEDFIIRLENLKKR